jgi:hypothetical protein
MSYTIAAAAAATGTSAITILSAIEDGRITGTKDERGEWHVEPDELHRVYPPVAERAMEGEAAQRSPAPDDADIEAQIETLIRQAGDQLRQQLDDVKRQRLPWWRRIAG